MKWWWTLVVAGLAACAVGVVPETEETQEAPEEAEKLPDGWAAPKDHGPSGCGPSGVKGGLEIPTECYVGPPRWLEEEPRYKK